ncbi:hypothetical protein QAD02_014050 [Eretmocerus hayati]|uniref:Uncharacterized protein n=1 Tax=Eretmocerus hayati TaxID=131215 RepID=A0ACC2P474_9HYME|nr:hypothetical protein QAD02_014050 [Eretmocerus hayati]
MAHILSKREVELRAHRDKIKSNAPNWHQLFLSDCKATTTANEQRFKAIEKKNDCILRALFQTDESEIKISGIPTSLNVSLIQLAVEILQEIGLSSLMNFVLDLRERPVEGNESHQSISVVLVGGVRRIVLRNSSELREETAQSFFGSGDSSVQFALLEEECDQAVFDIVDIPGTFLSEGDPNTHLSLDGFNFLRSDTIGKRGGGVGLYVRDCISVKILAQSEAIFDSKPEFLITGSIINSSKLLCAVMYRRPPAVYPTDSFNTLATFLPLNEHVIIMGDFNMDMSSINPK